MSAPTKNHSLIDHFLSAAHHARTGNYGDAALELDTAVQKLQPALTSSNVPQSLMSKLMYSLETMYAVQKQGDWVATADVIEFEFVALLRQIPGATSV
jgi:hypothetical protein